MKMCQRQKDGIQVVEISGEIDFHSSPELRKNLTSILDQPTAKVLINLKQVKYIDSSGLATFVEALQKMKRTNGKLALTDLNPSVRSVFEIAKLDRVFSLTASEDEAVRLLNA